jgi:hypothetical protein
MARSVAQPLDKTLYLDATLFLSLHRLATSAIGKMIAERLGFVGILRTPDGFKPV